MKSKHDLAQQLRQSIQGCTQHLHGPVQAWYQLRVYFYDDWESQKEVARLAIEDSLRKISDLEQGGYRSDDVSIQKEKITVEFLKSLYRLDPIDGRRD